MTQTFRDYHAPGVLGNVRGLCAEPLELLEQAHAAVGDFVRLPLVGRVAVYSVTHPDAIRHVLASNHRKYGRGVASSWLRGVLGSGLLTTDGEAHRQRQTALLPEWTKAAVHAMADRVTLCTRRASARWERLDGTTVDIEREMNALTLDIIGHFLFGVDFEREAPWVSDALVFGKDVMTELRTSVSMFLPRFIPTPMNRKLRALDARVQPALDRMLARRRSENWGHKRDLLSALLRHQAAHASDATPHCYAQDDALRAELVNFVAAGHETTATLLTWAFYYLAEHPNVEARVLEELDMVLGDREITVDDVSRLKYLGCVLSEVLRLRTPAWIIFRQATSADEIMGRPLPEGAVVLVSPHLVQRDACWFERPGEFDPERFSSGKPTWPRFAYIPYGGGPHVCIGAQLADLESRMIMASLLQHYSARLSPGVQVRPVTKITVVPEGGLPMRIERRVRGERASTRPNASCC